MVTILEALQNANANLENIKRIGIGILPLIQNQLHNALTLLEKGYDIDTEIEPLIDEFGSIDNIPEKE